MVPQRCNFSSVLCILIVLILFEMETKVKILIAILVVSDCSSVLIPSFGLELGSLASCSSSDMELESKKSGMPWHCHPTHSCKLYYHLVIFFFFFSFRELLSPHRNTSKYMCGRRDHTEALAWTLKITPSRRHILDITNM